MELGVDPGVLGAWGRTQRGRRATRGKGPLDWVGEVGKDRKRNQVLRARRAGQTRPALRPLTSEKGSGLECQLHLRGPGA